VATITLNSNLIVSGTTSYLFLTYDFSPSAVQASQGMRVTGPSDVFPADGTIAPFAQIQSSTVTVKPIYRSAGSLACQRPTGGFSVPAVATQGNKAVPIMKLTLQARNPSGGGVW